MKNYTRLTTLLLSLACFALHGQDQIRPYRSFATQKVHHQLLANYPEFEANLQGIEAHIQGYGSTGDERKDFIPIVFHILYSPAEPYPDEAQVLAQLDALNRDFEQYDPPEEAYALSNVQEMADAARDANTVFCLPPPALGGEYAIRFVETSVTVWKDDDAIKSSQNGGADPWDTKQYLNVWVGRLYDGIGGYAQLPGGPDLTDGIVIDYNYFGTGGTAVPPYDEGKTLTHLVGSYLGLYELWNDFQPCSDDMVDDTPIHNAPNFERGTEFHHGSLCDSTLSLEMAINFMDNTDDEALRMFTQGQKNRMKAVLSEEGWRSHLAAAGAAGCTNFGAGTTPPGLAFGQAGKGEGQFSLRLFPNPASGLLNLEVGAGEQGSVSFTAYNLLGVTVWQATDALSKGSHVFRQDCSAWGEGTFFVKAVFGDGSVLTQKVQMEKP